MQIKLSYEIGLDFTAVTEKDSHIAVTVVENR